MSELPERLDHLSNYIKGTVLGGPMLIDEAKRRIEELETALLAAHAYIERVGGCGEGGTCDHEVTLDAIREVLKDRLGIIRPASDKKVLWPTNLDPTAWE